jgi:mRNA-degrading endonuclease toxin of MazEF toxin-antitoxin module
MGLFGRLGRGIRRLLSSKPATETYELDPATVGRVRVKYAPKADDLPDAGEIVWTWVPYAERDGRGKDRPVLVVAKQSKDPQRRPSWADVDQLYSVHRSGLRRAGATLDARTFARVAAALRARHGWR